MRFDELKNEFLAVVKRILKKNLSNNIETLKLYKSDIIKKYNLIIQYFNKHTPTYTEDQLSRCKTEFDAIKAKFLSCLNRLHCVHELELSQSTVIDEASILDPITDIEFNKILSESSTDEDQSTSQDPPINISDLSIQSDLEIEKTIINNQDSDLEQSVNMATVTKLEFLRLCGETIPTIYSGNSLLLQSFLNSIELLATVSGTDESLTAALIAFIKTRLAGKALEVITPADTTVNLITVRLSNSIKPDNDKVIRGKMAALRADKNSLQEFSKQAEILADSLKRALVLDGIPHEKANAMTIDETISMCKSSAKTDYVKSILASTTFKNPKEVVAKFIIENGNEKIDKQILAFQHQQTSNKLWQRRTGNNNFSSYRSNGNFSNNRNNFNSNRRLSNYNVTRKPNQNSNRRWNSPRQNVRFTQSENLNAPQRQLGDTIQQSQVNNQQQ